MSRSPSTEDINQPEQEQQEAVELQEEQGAVEEQEAAEQPISVVNLDDGEEPGEPEPEPEPEPEVGEPEPEARVPEPEEGEPQLDVGEPRLDLGELVPEIDELVQELNLELGPEAYSDVSEPEPEAPAPEPEVVPPKPEVGQPDQLADLSNNLTNQSIHAAVDMMFRESYLAEREAEMNERHEPPVFAPAEVALMERSRTSDSTITAVAQGKTYRLLKKSPPRDTCCRKAKKNRATQTRITSIEKRRRGICLSKFRNFLSPTRQGSEVGYSPAGSRQKVSIFGRRTAKVEPLMDMEEDDGACKSGRCKLSAWVAKLRKKQRTADAVRRTVGEYMGEMSQDEVCQLISGSLDRATSEKLTGLRNYLTKMTIDTMADIISSECNKEVEGQRSDLSGSAEPGSGSPERESSSDSSSGTGFCNCFGKSKAKSTCSHTSSEIGIRSVSTRDEKSKMKRWGDRLRCGCGVVPEDSEESEKVESEKLKTDLTRIAVSAMADIISSEPYLSKVDMTPPRFSKNQRWDLDQGSQGFSKSTSEQESIRVISKSVSPRKKGLCAPCYCFDRSRKSRATQTPISISDERPSKLKRWAAKLKRGCGMRDFTSDSDSVVEDIESEYPDEDSVVSRSAVRDVVDQSLSQLSQENVRHVMSGTPDPEANVKLDQFKDNLAKLTVNAMVGKITDEVESKKEMGEESDASSRRVIYRTVNPVKRVLGCACDCFWKKKKNKATQTLAQGMLQKQISVQGEGRSGKLKLWASKLTCGRREGVVVAAPTRDKWRTEVDAVITRDVIRERLEFYLSQMSNNEVCQIISGSPDRSTSQKLMELRNDLTKITVDAMLAIITKEQQLQLVERPASLISESEVESDEEDMYNEQLELALEISVYGLISRLLSHSGLKFDIYDTRRINERLREVVWTKVRGLDIQMDLTDILTRLHLLVYKDVCRLWEKPEFVLIFLDIGTKTVDEAIAFSFMAHLTRLKRRCGTLRRVLGLNPL